MGRFALFSRLANFLEDRYRSHPANFLVYSAIVTAVIGGLVLAGLSWLPAYVADTEAVPISSTEPPAAAPEAQAAEPNPAPPADGSGQSRIRSTVQVQAIDPVIHSCAIAVAKACFRLPIRVSTATDSDVQVGYEGDGPGMAGTQSIFVDGTVCKGYPAGGLHPFSKYHALELQTASPDRPIVGMIEFGCDGELFAGAKASIEINLSLARPGTEQQNTLFALASLPLKAERRRR